MPRSENYHILTKHKTVAGISQTIMIPITEEEEIAIDNIDKEVLRFDRGERTFSVTMKDVYCYGEINFADKDTINRLESLTFLDYLGAVGKHIFSNYNYVNHTCSSPKKYPLWTETFSKVLVAKYAHGCLGKPNRVLIFKHITK